MKRFIYLASALAMLAAVSCNKDNGPQTGDPVDATFTATLKALAYTPESDPTKAVIGQDLSETWTAGDEIAICDGQKANKFTAAQADGAKATFNGQVGYGSTDFYAVYPYSAVSSAQGNVAKVTLPASQSASVTPIIAVGKADAKNDVALKNVISYLKVKVSADVTSVKISGTKGEKLAGEFSVNAETGAVKADPTESEISFTPSGAGTYFVGIVPVEIAEGLKIDFISPAGNKSYLTGPFSFDRGMVSDADSIAVTKAATYAIKDAAGLKAWYDVQESWSEGDVVTLEGDIDMAGMVWNPVDFAGSFDGKGHKIYNFVQNIESANAGFFGTVSGPVSNVIFGSKDGKNYDGTSKITVTGEGGWRYVGIIAKAKADLKNITTFVPVDLPAGNELKVRGATLLGLANKKDMVVENCVSYASLSCNNPETETANEAIFGGIISCCDGGQAGDIIYVRNCKFYGSVISLNPYTTCVGGIVSNCPSTKLAVIEDCENFGTVAINTTTTPTDYKEGYVGGIAGLLNGNNTAGIIVRNCINHADILCSGITVGDMGGIAGRIPTGQILNCTNEGKVTFEGNVAGKALLIGGITGGMYKGGTVDGCINKGAVTSNKNQVNRLGGIVGTVNDGDEIVSNCKNEAPCTITRTAASTNWQACGGIIGFQEKSTSFKLENCANSGKVSVSMENNTTHDNGVTAGGIIGLGVINVASKGNSNSADVTVDVTGTTTIAYAGGIAGKFSAATVTSNGDKSVCAVSLSAQGAGKSAVGAAVGCNAGVVTAPVLGGSVNGTAVSASNVSTIAVGEGNAATGATLAN